MTLNTPKSKETLSHAVIRPHRGDLLEAPVRNNGNSLALSLVPPALTTALGKCCSSRLESQQTFFSSVP